MYDTLEARKFIDSNTTSIGGIQLLKENRELEIDPTVAQCWDCGILNPTHTSRNCPGPRRCIKCLQHNHQFHSCHLPKDFNIMTPEQKKTKILHSLSTERRPYITGPSILSRKKKNYPRKSQSS